MGMLASRLRKLEADGEDTGNGIQRVAAAGREEKGGFPCIPRGSGGDATYSKHWIMSYDETVTNNPQAWAHVPKGVPPARDRHGFNGNARGKRKT